MAEEKIGRKEYDVDTWILAGLIICLAIFGLVILSTLANHFNRPHLPEGIQLLGIDADCGQNNYNAGRLSSSCESFCEAKDMSCLNFKGKDCNIDTGETQFTCLDDANEVRTYLPILEGR